ncbi:MAG: hypothetical protein NTY35_02665 [Planctomycetota bacterium]|nr:hypothetical protein [Planctomycetota bacterium]
MRWRVHLLVLPWVSALSVSATAQTYYRSSPGASDAERIATDMLNDAASGRFRQQSFGLPENPFARMKEEYEAERRAQWEELEQAAEDRRYREQAQAEYEAAYAAELAREEAAYAATTAFVERMNAFEADAAAGNPRAYLQMASTVQRGEHKGYDVQFGDRSEEDYVRTAYVNAAHYGSDLGFVGAVSLGSGDEPNFAWLRDEVRRAGSADQRLEILWGRAQRGHLGAMLLLGAWYAGRDVDLGSRPAPLPGCADAHASALRALRMAMEKDFGRGASWCARELLVGATPDERAEALGILRRASDSSTDYECRKDALTVLGTESLGIPRCADESNEGIALLSQAADLTWAPAGLILGDAFLAGRDGRYLPASAAGVYERLPQSDLWWEAQGRVRLHTAIGAEFRAENLRPTKTPWVAYGEAWSVYQRAAERGLPETADARECKTWLLSSYVRHRRKSERFPDPIAALREMAAGGELLPRLLLCFATLDDKETSRGDAESAWAALADLDLFVRPLEPTQVLLVLGCVERVLERGAFPELERELRGVAKLPAQKAPVAGSAQIARLYFTPLQPHDTSDRAGLPRIYSRLIAGAWQHDPSLWWHAAALAEVLQIDPLTPEQWKDSWLLQFRESRPCSSKEQYVLADMLAQPTEDSIASAEELLSKSTGLAEQPAVLALFASLRLRSDSSDEVRRSAYEQLIALAERGSWHAQALLEDYEPRYRAAYLERLDAAGFEADCARAAELVASSRESGRGFARPDPALRARAIGTALVHGSTRYARTDLDALAPAAPAEVARQIALLDALAAQDEPLVRRIDREVTAYYLRRHFEFSGIPTECDTRTEQMFAVGEELSEKFGPARAVDFLERQIPEVPEIGWELGTWLLGSHRWIPADPQRGLEMVRTTARTGRALPGPIELVFYMEGLGELGTRADCDIIDGLLARPEYSVDALRLAWSTPGGGFATYAATCDRLALEAEGADRDRLADDAVRHWISALRCGSGDALVHVESAWTDAPAERCARVGRAMLEACALNSPLAVPWLQRACAGGDAVACAELARWIDPATGRPSKRHAWSIGRIETLVREYRERYGEELSRGDILAVDFPDKPSRERIDLLNASRDGDELAHELVLELGIAKGVLARQGPEQWIETQAANLERGDLEALQQAGVELPAIWDELERTKGLDADEDRCRELGRVAGRIGTLFHRLEAVSAGERLEQVRSIATTALTVGIQCGDVESFRAELARRREKGDAAVLDLCSQVLEQDPCNAPAIEKYALPILADRAPLLQQFQAAGLYTAGSAEPNPMMLYARSVCTELCAKYSEKYATPTEAVLLPRLPFAHFGFLGRALWRDAQSRGSAEARRLLQELGYGPADWDRIFKY